MLKYAKIVDNTGLCNIALGDDGAFFEALGFELLDVSQNPYGEWYLTSVMSTAEYEARMAQKERERLDALVLSKRAFWLGLLTRFDKEKSDVVAAIEALEVDAKVKKMALIELDEASGFERKNPLFNLLAPLLGLTSADVDELFVEGNG